MTNESGGTTTLQLVLVWCLVGIPLLWGVIHTFENALKLFH
ncbi:MAG TPA: hypothetical protein VN715_02260 [Roseiarcus sp.]|nr:hypothetical protein [Roseiarcus sp.]